MIFATYPKWYSDWEEILASLLSKSHFCRRPQNHMTYRVLKIIASKIFQRIIWQNIEVLVVTHILLKPVNDLPVNSNVRDIIWSDHRLYAFTNRTTLLTLNNIQFQEKFQIETFDMFTVLETSRKCNAFCAYLYFSIHQSIYIWNKTKAKRMSFIFPNKWKKDKIITGHIVDNFNSCVRIWTSLSLDLLRAFITK